MTIDVYRQILHSILTEVDNSDTLEDVADEIERCISEYGMRNTTMALAIPIRLGSLNEEERRLSEEQMTEEYRRLFPSMN